MGGPRTECQILQGIEDGDEEEKAAKVTEGLQVRNWVMNVSVLKAKMKKTFQEKRVIIFVKC